MRRLKEFYQIYPREAPEYRSGTPPATPNVHDGDSSKGGFTVEKSVLHVSFVVFRSDPNL